MLGTGLRWLDMKRSLALDLARKDMALHMIRDEIGKIETAGAVMWS